MSWELECKKISEGIRLRVLEHTINHGGYLSQACSSAEIFSILYNKLMRLGPSEGRLLPNSFQGTPSKNNPSKHVGMLYNGAKNPNLDRFFLSPSHYALTLYATLIETKRLNEKSLNQFNIDGSVLEMIGSEHSPGHETNGGSFGQTISQAAGVAWARSWKKEKGLVWLFLSDGEFQEGQTWEALMSMAFHKISNIKIVVDVNGQQVDGRTSDVMNLEPFLKKVSSFGACVKQVDGHNLRALNNAFETFHEDKPLVVLAKTLPYKGMDILEGRYPFLHYVRFKDEHERNDFKNYLKQMKSRKL